MKSVSLLLLAVLLPADLHAVNNAKARTARGGPVPPSITVREAVGANPGTVFTSGQTRVVAVSWNAGSDYPYCEIYYTINGANQTELGREHDGSRSITVTAGSTYAFWMIVYLGAQGQDVRTVTELTVVAERGAEPAPAVPPASSSAPGPTPNPARSICDYARIARARNSAAAPALEAKCRAAGSAADPIRRASISGARAALQSGNSIEVIAWYLEVVGFGDETTLFLGQTACNDRFSVSATIIDNSARQRNPSPDISVSRLTSSFLESRGSRYYCRYLFSGLPLNQAISVSVAVVPTFADGLIQASGIEQPPQPPRTILDATRTVTLNASQRRASVSFEMVFARD